MWDWIIDNSVWILIVDSVLVVLLLFFNERIRAWLSKIEPDKWQRHFWGNITAIFWIIEIILILVLIMGFLALALAREGTRALTMPKVVETWFLAHGLMTIVILVVGIVLWIVVKKTIPPLVRRVMSRPQKGESREGLRRRANTLEFVFLGLSRIIIVLLVIFMILSELNVSVGPILAGFGAILLGVGFGLQYLVRDLIAGVFILMENQYRVGDVAKVADVTGLVEEINLRKTVLRDLDGIVHHVPNGEIRVASNYSRHFSRVNLNISVAYGTDLNFAIKVINRVCEEMSKEEKWSKVFQSVPQVLRVDSLGDSGIDIKIIGNVKPLEQWSVMGELRLRLKNEFDKEGIEIPWPHTKVYFGDKPGD
jgi:small-conductance mechanosensitive channel